MQAVNFQPFELVVEELDVEVSMKEFTALKGLQVLAVMFPLSATREITVQKLALDTELTGQICLAAIR